MGIVILVLTNLIQTNLLLASEGFVDLKKDIHMKIIMDSRLSVVTLGVSELEKSVRFYKDGIGFSYREDISNGHIAFFQMNSLLLALYPKNLLAEDAGVAIGENGFSGITLAQNVGSVKEVDELLILAKESGASITKNGEQKPWGGYSGYFQDLDGYLWEVGFYPDLNINKAESKLTFFTEKDVYVY
jgi:predicted lactoylglutathione lyase